MAFRHFLALFLLMALVAEGKRIKDSIYKDLSSGFSACFRRNNGSGQIGCSSSKDGDVGVIHYVSGASDLDWLLNSGGPYSPYVVMFAPKMFNFPNLKLLQDWGKVAGVILLPPLGEQPLDELPKEYSEDSVCPNQIASLYAGDGNVNCGQDDPWNKAGSDLLHHDWPFPIVLIREDELATFLVQDCYAKYNHPGPDLEPRTWPQCAVELQTFMFSAVDSETCLRRSNYLNIVTQSSDHCSKLGDKSVFALLNPPSRSQGQPLPRSSSSNKNGEASSYPPNSVTAVITQLDAVTMFDGVEFGSGSPSTGVAVLLAVAKLVFDDSRKVSTTRRPETANDVPTSNVLFGFLTGESFDYIGSSKLLYDMREGNFPWKWTKKGSSSGDEVEDVVVPSSEKTREWPLIKPESIQSVLEIGQLGSSIIASSREVATSGEELFAHVDTEFSGQDMLERLKRAASEAGVVLKEATSPRSRGLPPSSLQSFLKTRRADLPGILVADFDQRFANPYFHSIYDNFTMRGTYDHSKGPDQPLVEHLSRVAESLAAFLVAQERRGNAGGPATRPKLDRTLMNDILHCYIQSGGCRLFNESSTADTPPNVFPPMMGTPYPQYVGVVQSITFHAVMTQRLLAFLTGEVVQVEAPADCVTPKNQSVYLRQYMKGGRSDDPDCVIIAVDQKVNDTTPNNCGVCMESTTALMDAVSPAFLIPGYDLKDPTYGAWTESTWRSFTGRVFLKANPAVEKGYLFCGVVVTLVSFLLVWRTSSGSSYVFVDVAEEDTVNVWPQDGAAAASSSDSPPRNGGSRFEYRVPRSDSGANVAAL